MRFESRELKDYAEPVNIDDLQIGLVYFSVQFLDEDMVVPILQPLVFLGTNLSGERENKYYFVDYEAYSQGIRSIPTSDRELGVFQVASRSNLKHIFEYERALDVLMACALRRRMHPA